MRDFYETVQEYYLVHGRHDLPWRQPRLNGVFDPYYILVSEIMLQQTQVARVVPKFTEFIRIFPDSVTLAGAEIGEVIRIWQGLGYNRRAKFLWQASQVVQQEWGGVIPNSTQLLELLPGVGKNTAGAIAAYAFNSPVVFVETNIRTVFIHHFYENQDNISDLQIQELATVALDHAESPRDWYWALMDYGTYLKQTVGNLNKLSKSYIKQNKFQGSKRQLRGLILRTLSDTPASKPDLLHRFPDERVSDVLDDLVRESLVKYDGSTCSL
jgi:A/G-specific adenine glycosylase